MSTARSPDHHDAPTGMSVPGLFAGAAFIVLFAGGVLGLAPERQLSDLVADEGLKPYTAQEARGRELYVSMGCAYCHSQQPRDPGQGPDGKRGWGRASTPQDYLFDTPHQLGTMRTGPDLLNIGARQPSVAWHMLHLYQPRAVVPGSIMPSYPYLFEGKPDDKLLPHEQPLTLTGRYAPPAGTVVVPTDDARDLVAYLLSLDRTHPSADLEHLADGDHAEGAPPKKPSP